MKTILWIMRLKSKIHGIFLAMTSLHQVHDQIVRSSSMMIMFQVRHIFQKRKIGVLLLWSKIISDFAKIWLKIKNFLIFNMDSGDCVPSRNVPRKMQKHKLPCWWSLRSLAVSSLHQVDDCIMRSSPILIKFLIKNSKHAFLQYGQWRLVLLPNTNMPLLMQSLFATSHIIAARSFIQTLIRAFLYHSQKNKGLWTKIKKITLLTLIMQGLMCKMIGP